MKPRVRHNRHHVIHHRVDWTARPESEYIREHPSLIFDMEVPLHNETHRSSPPVPLLGVFALQTIVRDWRPDVRDKLRSLENLQRSIEVAGNHPKAHPIEKSLGYLAIEALDLQKPFLLESLGSGRIIVV